MADASLLHALVENHISATLLMKKFHPCTRTIQKYVNTSIRRVLATTAYNTAQRVDTLTKVNTIREDHKDIAFT